MKCVTRQGNEYDPSGILTGGDMSGHRSILRELHYLNTIEDEYRHLQKRALVTQQLLNEIKLKSKTVLRIKLRFYLLGENYRSLKEELEYKEHEKSLVEKEERIRDDGKINNNINQIGNQIESEERGIALLQNDLSKYENELEGLQSDLALVGDEDQVCSGIRIIFV